MQFQLITACMYLKLPTVEKRIQAVNRLLKKQSSNHLPVSASPIGINFEKHIKEAALDLQVDNG
jgi:hypothetical protein